MKKIAIIGKGTAGALTASHFAYWAPNLTIDWYFDENIKTQAVGEGTTLQVPKNLQTIFDFHYTDLKNLNGHYKYGIRKQNWGKTNHDFFHTFDPPYMAMHIDAHKLQDYIVSKLSKFPNVNIIPKNIKSHDEIDTDYIIDCSGKPKNFDDFHIAEHIPVNSVYVTQCYWEKPLFDYSAAVARKHGWVFCLPLQNRCSVGYLYNNTVNNLDDIKTDVKEVFEAYNLIPSENTSAFSFKNYFRKINYTERVTFNGNASFFLEPMEAQSFVAVDRINRFLFDYLIHQKISLTEANKIFLLILSQMELMIAIHYTKKSKFNTKFWNFAYQKTNTVFDKLKLSHEFNQILYRIKKFKPSDNLTNFDILDSNKFTAFGSWETKSWYQNLMGLGYTIKEF